MRAELARIAGESEGQRAGLPDSRTSRSDVAGVPECRAMRSIVAGKCEALFTGLPDFRIAGLPDVAERRGRTSGLSDLRTSSVVP